MSETQILSCYAVCCSQSEKSTLPPRRTVQHFHWYLSQNLVPGHIPVAGRLFKASGGCNEPVMSPPKTMGQDQGVRMDMEATGSLCHSFIFPIIKIIYTYSIITQKTWKSIPSQRENHFTFWSSFSVSLYPIPIISIFIDLKEKLEYIYIYYNIYIYILHITKLGYYYVEFFFSQLKLYCIFSNVLFLSIHLTTYPLIHLTF